MVVSPRKPVNIVFTNHAKKRMKKKHILEEEAIATIHYPETTKKIEGKYYAQKHIGRGKIEVVFEKETYIKVITLYWI